MDPEFNPLFQSHMLNTSGKAKAQNIARGFDKLLWLVTQYVPDSREMSLIRTKLEEACFYAKRGMAMQPENQDMTSNVV